MSPLWLPRLIIEMHSLLTKVGKAPRHYGCMITLTLITSAEFGVAQLILPKSIFKKSKRRTSD